uniref:Uncharacterized protein n=1 Tax=Avena sativa TaxID=4498 RepID=A0ACD6A9Y4_AVESA
MAPPRSAPPATALRRSTRPALTPQSPATPATAPPSPAPQDRAPRWEQMNADILVKIFDSIPSATDRARAAAVCRHWRATDRTRAWDELTGDLLNKIFALIPSATDRARASAVCRHWRDTAKANPPLLPWLLMPSGAGVSYYKIFEGSLLELAGAVAANAAGARFCGSFPGGWFVVARQEAPHHALINLQSGRVFVLPDLLRLHGAADVPVVIQASTVLAPPVDDGGCCKCTIAAITSGQTPIAFWRTGMSFWTPPLPTAVEDRPGWRAMLPATMVEDIIYNDGCFVVLTRDERVLCYMPVDAQDGMLTMKLQQVDAFVPAAAPNEPVAARYLLVSSSGRLLLMVRRIQVHDELRFEITCRHQGSWLNLRALHNQALFLARGCSRAVETSLPARIFYVDDALLFQEGVDSFQSTDTGLYIHQPQRTVRCLPSREQSGSSQWTWWIRALSRPSELVEVAVAQPDLVTILLELVVWLVIAAIFIRIFLT